MYEPPPNERVASPKGEARREYAAKRERSDTRGGTLLTRVRVILRLRVGVGGAVLQEPYQPSLSARLPHHLRGSASRPEKPPATS